MKNLLLPGSALCSRHGYVMLIALILLAILSVIGATSLSVSGVDQQIALYNRKHMMMLNTADAGISHARQELAHKDPRTEFTEADSSSLSPADSAYFVTKVEAENEFQGTSYAHNLGVYQVNAIFERCGNPPPGYSTELGGAGYRSDYWSMQSTSLMLKSDMVSLANTASSSVIAILRKVNPDVCKM